MKYLITENELNILRKYSTGLISKTEMENSIEKKAICQEMEYILDKFIEDKNFHDFESVFWYMPNNMNKTEESYLYKKYLLLDGHFQHENIVMSFQSFFYDDKENIHVLLKAIEQIPEYLNYEDIKYPYIRKIIYAIGAQPEPYNIEALEQLTQFNDKTIKDLALHQIEKRMKYGRWEFEKNEKEKK